MRVSGSWERRGPASVDLSWLALSLLVTSAVAVSDALLPPETVLSGLLIVGPALACARLDAVRTAWVSGYTVLLSIGLGFANGRVGALSQDLRLVVLLIGACLAIFLAYNRTLRERSLATVARVAQQAILLPFSAPVGDVDIAIRYRSADRDALVGGDLFDAANTSFGLRVVIGDARGKGLSATVTAAAALRGFRNAAYVEPALETLVEHLDTELAGQLDSEDFVTAAIVEFGPGRVTILNCGHHPPVLLSSTEPAFLTPHEPAPPLGMGMGTRPEPRSVQLQPDQAVVLYTDGLAEARDAEDNMFDVLAACRELTPAASPNETLNILLEHLDTHTAGARDDDITLIYCRPLP